MPVESDSEVAVTLLRPCDDRVSVDTPVPYVLEGIGEVPQTEPQFDEYDSGP
jgi:hypothetical protein